MKIEKKTCLNRVINAYNMRLYVNITEQTKDDKVERVNIKQFIHHLRFILKYVYKHKLCDYSWSKLNNKNISINLFYTHKNKYITAPFSKLHQNVITHINDHINTYFLSDINLTWSNNYYKNIKWLIHGWFNLFFRDQNHKKQLINEQKCFDEWLYWKKSCLNNTINQWKKHYKHTINMIASENIPRSEISRANGSFVYYKYAEGYPNKRYYEGCEYADKIESDCIKNCCKLFLSKHANVQSYSGTTAVISAVMSLEKFIDNKVIVSFDVTSGGHISHGGLKNSMLRKIFTFYQIKHQSIIDLSIIEQYVNKHKPSIVIIGFSAYTRKINYRLLYLLLRKHNVKIIIDISHIAGLIAANLHQNPIKYCDIVVSTTHKTLNGPRGAFILTNHLKYKKAIDAAVFPLLQGGPFIHNIYAKNLCFLHAASNKFKIIQQNIINYSVYLNKYLNQKGICTVGISENHTILIDLSKHNVCGQQISKILYKIGIVTNSNLIFSDALNQSHKNTGVRLGTTTLGNFRLKHTILKELGDIISTVILEYFTILDEQLLILKNRVYKLAMKINQLKI